MSDPIIIELFTKVRFSAGVSENQKEGIFTELRTQFLRDFSYGSFGNISKEFFKGISNDAVADYRAICEANSISVKIGSR